MITTPRAVVAIGWLFLASWTGGIAAETAGSPPTQEATRHFTHGLTALAALVALLPARRP